MIHHVSLEHQIMITRKNKKLKAQKDRLLDACRDLIMVIELSPRNTIVEKAMLDKAKKAIELGNE